jgi:hypothetical protein
MHTSLQKPDAPGGAREGSIATASEDDIGRALDRFTQGVT